MTSKTIIITSQNNHEKGRGILSIIQEDDLLKFRLRLYNVNKLSQHCKLGIYHQNKVYSANLLEKHGVYETSMVGDFDMDQDFYSAIINTVNNEVLLAGGTYSGYYFNDYSVFDNTENKSDKPLITTENQTSDNCEKFCSNCENCIYKEYFYSHNEDITTDNLVEKKNTKNTINEIKLNTDTQNQDLEQHTTSIIQSLIPQFDYVFENYDNDNILNDLLPNSKFVKINENNEKYSIGVIYENNTIKYICYAILCNYNTPAPQELGKHYQWLPIDKEDPLSEGYYIVFQDANDLKILEI